MTMTLLCHLLCQRVHACVRLLNGFPPLTLISPYLECRMLSMQILIQILQQIDNEGKAHLRLS